MADSRSVLLAAFAFIVTFSIQAAEGPSADELVAQLDSYDFNEREFASETLRARLASETDRDDAMDALNPFLFSRFPEQRIRVRGLFQEHQETELQRLHSIFLDLVISQIYEYETKTLPFVRKLLIHKDLQNYYALRGEPVESINTTLSSSEQETAAKERWILCTVNADPALRAQRPAYSLKIPFRMNLLNEADRRISRRYGLDKLPDSFDLSAMVFPQVTLIYRAKGYPPNYLFSASDFVFDLGIFADFGEVLAILKNQSPALRYIKEKTNLFGREGEGTVKLLSKRDTAIYSQIHLHLWHSPKSGSPDP